MSLGAQKAETFEGRRILSKQATGQCPNCHAPVERVLTSIDGQREWVSVAHRWPYGAVRHRCGK